MKTVWIESNRIALLCECKTMSYHKKVNFMTTIMEKISEREVHNWETIVHDLENE